MNGSDVAVATITWARSPAEEQVLRHALPALAATGLPVVVADRPHSASFSQFLRGLPGVDVVAPVGDGLVGQVRIALATAAARHRRFVLYTEPDKESFFTRDLQTFIAHAPDDDDVGVVLAARNAASFATFPSMQTYAEGVANELCWRLCGERGDYFYGPCLIASRLLDRTDELDPTLGWGWRPFLFRVARNRGCRLVHVDGHHPCPVDQTIEDEGERIHRLRQLTENIRGLIAGHQLARPNRDHQ